MNTQTTPFAEFDDIPLNRMVTYRLTRLTAQMNAQAAKILKQTAGISQTQWRVLVLIDCFGPVSPARIACDLVIDKGQLSRALKAMAETGMIYVKTSASDQRMQVIHATDHGRNLFERARPAMRARQARLSSSLGAQEQDMLFTALEKLEAAVKT